MSYRPPRTVYHGTDASFETFDTSRSFGAHFGTRKAGLDRLKSTGRSRIEYIPYKDHAGRWWALEEMLSNRPRFEHGPFTDESSTLDFIDNAPRQRQPLAFEIDAYRPLVLPDLGTWEFQSVVRQLQKQSPDTFGPCVDDWYLCWNRSSEAGWASVHQSLNEAGYDCICYLNETEDPGEPSWIVWDSSRIHPSWSPPPLARRVYEDEEMSFPQEVPT